MQQNKKICFQNKPPLSKQEQKLHPKIYPYLSDLGGFGPALRKCITNFLNCNIWAFKCLVCILKDRSKEERQRFLGFVRIFTDSKGHRERRRRRRILPEFLVLVLFFPGHSTGPSENMTWVIGTRKGVLFFFWGFGSGILNGYAFYNWAVRLCGVLTFARFGIELAVGFVRFFGILVGYGMVIGLGKLIHIFNAVIKGILNCAFFKSRLTKILHQLTRDKHVECFW